MKGLLVVLLIALLGTAVVADLPNNDVEQLEEADSSTYDAAQAESINAVPTETMDPEEREKAEVYSAAAHLTNHISFGGATAHSEASPYASLFQVQEMDSRRLAEKDMALDNINIVPEENDDSHAPVIPFYASSDMTELADPLTDIESEHHVDEQEDQAMDHAADVLAEDVEASDVAELSLSAPSLVEEEELPHVHEEDDASFLETLDEDNEDAEEADDSAESDEQDDEEDDDAEEHDDATATAPHEEEDDSYTEERDDSFDDNHADADADNHTPAAADDEAADAPAPAATTEAADEDHHTVGEQEAAAAPAEADDLVQAAAEAPAAAAADPTAPQAASDVTANVQDA